MGCTPTIGPASRFLLTPHGESPNISHQRKPFTSNNKSKQSDKRNIKGPSSITGKRRHTLPTPRHSRSSRRSRCRRSSRTRHVERPRPSWIWRFRAAHSTNGRGRSTSRRRAGTGRRGVNARWDNRGIDARVLSSNAGHRYHFLGYNVLCARHIRLGAIFKGERAVGLRVIRLRRVGKLLYRGNGVHDQGICCWLGVVSHIDSFLQGLLTWWALKGVKETY